MYYMVINDNETSRALFKEVVPVKDFATELLRGQERIAKILNSSEYDRTEKTARISSHISAVFAKLLAKIGPVKKEPSGKKAGPEPQLDTGMEINEIKMAGQKYFEIVIETGNVIDSFYGKGS